MIQKLIVLNNTEGHKFEVGKPYVYFDINQMVREITIISQGHRIIFDDKSHMDVLTNNVMLFKSGG